MGMHLSILDTVWGRGAGWGDGEESKGKVQEGEDRPVSMEVATWGSPETLTELFGWRWNPDGVG